MKALFRYKYSILPALIIIIAYAYIVNLLSFKAWALEWTVFIIYIIIIFLLGFGFYSQRYLLWALFTWGTGMFLISIGLVSSALPSYEHGCLIQWLSNFKYSPWTMSLGNIKNNREILLWSPGLLFAIFIGIISILGYEASKKAKDILLRRISSDNFVSEIGKLLNKIRTKSLKSRIYMIVSSPLIGQLIDDYNYDQYIKPFWNWVLDNNSRKDLLINIICLTDLSAWEQYQDDCEDEYLELKKYCDGLEILQKENIPNLNIIIKRRDNLPFVQMLIIRNQDISTGIFFMMRFSKKKNETKLEIQGFLTEDPAVVDILSRIFEEEISYEEPITSIGTERLYNNAK